MSQRYTIWILEAHARSIGMAFAAVLVLSSLTAAQSAGEGWMARVTRTQAEQPHWITPLATTTPRLEQEFRYDVDWLQTTTGTTTNFGVSKGLELIPARQVEVILGVPPYFTHTQPRAGRLG